jgi:Asp-tRNA(Asn)/Glu-tRNA(Gln) amidotransferase A subunit family amidase
MRMVILKVKYENRIDVFVNPTITLPPSRNGFASQPETRDRPNGRFPTSANVGIPELTVPAGFNDVDYEPEFSLNAAKDNYSNSANETKPSTLPAPMPFGMSFWSGPGEEPTLLRVASLYEGATRHRRPPPDFGPLPSHAK